MTTYSDIEVTMQMLRMMRSGQYRTAQKLLADLKEDIPEIADEQVDRCLASLKRSLERWV